MPVTCDTTLLSSRVSRPSRSRHQRSVAPCRDRLPDDTVVVDVVVPALGQLGDPPNPVAIWSPRNSKLPMGPIRYGLSERYLACDGLYRDPAHRHVDASELSGPGAPRSPWGRWIRTHRARHQQHGRPTRPRGAASPVVDTTLTALNHNFVACIEWPGLTLAYDFAPKRGALALSCRPARLVRAAHRPVGRIVT